MKVTIERKIFVVVAGIALLSLVADLVLLAEHDRELAGVVPPTLSSNHASSSVPGGELAAFLEPVDLQKGLLLAERIRRIGGAHGVRGDGSGRNAFAAVEAWVTEFYTPDLIADASSEAEDGFSKSHRLMGVIPNTPTPCAAADGMPIVVGQAIDGYTLEKVLVRFAVFSNGSTRVELHLDDRPLVLVEVE